MNVDISNVSIGQEFKNLQELSVALTGERIPKGSGYAPRVKHLQKYLSWASVEGTRKVIITEIYDTPKVVSVRGTYTPQLLANLYTLELEKKYTIYDLYERLGLTNERFTQLKYYTKNLNAVRISSPAYSAIHSQIEQVLNQSLYQILSRQRERGLFDYRSSYKYYFSPGFEEISIPDNYIDSLKCEALNHFGYSSEWAIIHSSVNEEYHKYILKHLGKYNVKKYAKCFIFENFNPPINLPEPSLEKLKEMNSLKIKKHFEGLQASYPIYFDKVITLIDTFFS